MSAVVVIHSGELGELLAAQFERYGMASTWMRSLADAGEYLFDHGARLVVLDLTLDGALAFAEGVKRTRSLPVVGLHPQSFRSTPEHPDRTARVEALDAHFQTPFRSLAVIEACATIVGHRLPASSSSSSASSADRDDEDDRESGAQDDLAPSALEVATLPPAPVDAEVTDPGARIGAPMPSLLPQRPVADSTLEGEITGGTVIGLLEAFHQSQTTGEIWLFCDERRDALLLVRGDIVGARTTEPEDKIDHLAVSRGVVSAAALEEARAAVSARRAPHLLEALSSVAGVSRAELRILCETRTRAVAYRAVATLHGRYRVTAAKHGAREPVPVSLSVPEAVVRGMIAHAPIDRLRELVPEDARFGPAVDAPYTLNELVLTGLEARFVVAMDGTKTTSDLAILHDGLAERVRLGLTCGLLRLGLVQLVGRGPAEPRKISFF